MAFRVFFPALDAGQ